jgi:hypothetical protein
VSSRPQLTPSFQAHLVHLGNMIENLTLPFFGVNWFFLQRSVRLATLIMAYARGIKYTVSSYHMRREKKKEALWAMRTATLLRYRHCDLTLKAPRRRMERFFYSPQLPRRKCWHVPSTLDRSFMPCRHCITIAYLK